MRTYKEKIAENFSVSSNRYDQHAVVQKKSAGTLSKLVLQADKQVPDGPVIEIGCGTGSLSSSILEAMPQRKIILADLAPGMIKICKKKLTSLYHNLDHVQWLVMDAEQITDRNMYSLIVSGMTMQWFENINQTIEKFIDALKPGGKLIFSFLGQESFPEWSIICSELNIPCTAIPLPDYKNILKNISLSQEVEHWKDTLPIIYSSAKEFFHSLKNTGANTSVNGQPALNAGQMKQIFKHWGGKHPEGQVTVTYSINYIVVQK